jgi:hypothetical protein
VVTEVERMQIIDETATKISLRAYRPAHPTRRAARDWSRVAW